MITAAMCRLHSLVNIEKYCTEEIEPLLLKNNGNITFGKYNEDGSQHYCIYALYAKDRPSLHSLGTPTVHPADIAMFLKGLGYEVEWVQIKEWYSAGYSGTRRTKYYDAGYNTFYSLQISC